MIKPEYSREEVNRAGLALCRRDFSELHIDEQSHYISVLSNWRSAHSYPINTFQATIRKKLKVIDSSALFAQRLKRMPSIVAKLERFEKMRLSRMQDIGGLRVVVKNAGKVYELRDAIISSRFSHKLVTDKDYINAPKDSGYRGIHLVYKYKSQAAPCYDGLCVEIQLRTKLQHSWATAVETMSTFLQESLKASQGSEEWLEFFSLAGSAFALLEKKNVAEKYKGISSVDLIARLLILTKDLDVFDSLKAFRVAANAISKDEVKKAHYYLLCLRTKERVVRISGFKANELDKATKRYMELEQEVDGEQISQVVLVAADSIQQLKKAYPNYFLDTSNFTDALQKIISSYLAE